MSTKEHTQTYRQKQKERGLVRKEHWATEEQHKIIKQLIKRFKNEELQTNNEY